MKNLTTKETYFILFFIILFSLFIRIINLEKNPNGFTVDEAQFGYDAYSILKIGMDHYGKFFPFYFEGLGYGANPVFVYSIIPFIKFMGLSIFSVRFTSVFWGILTIIGTYFLTKEIYDEKIALVSSFLVSISPWAFQYSRMAITEIVSAPPFIIFGILFLIRGVKKSDEKQLYLGSFLLIFSTYTHAIAKLFSPILFFSFIVIYRKFFKKHIKTSILCLLIFLITITPVFYFTFFDIGNRRFTTVSIFDENYLNQNREKLNSKYIYTPGLNLLIKNDYFVYSYIFLNNYLSHISLDFLFLTGDQILRHSIRGFGQLFIFELPLI